MTFGDNTENELISQKIEKSCNPPAKQPLSSDCWRQGKGRNNVQNIVENV